MDRYFIEQQVANIQTSLKAGNFDKEDRRIWVILEYLYSLLKPESYSTQQTEDLRRLVLEMNFDVERGFEEWLENDGVKK